MQVAKIIDHKISVVYVEDIDNGYYYHLFIDNKHKGRFDNEKQAFEYANNL